MFYLGFLNSLILLSFAFLNREYIYSSCFNIPIYYFQYICHFRIPVYFCLLVCLSVFGGYKSYFPASLNVL